LTTDSGSNNFTMAKEMARILRIKSGDFKHYADHHPRCFCHVLALILGAGLRSLKLKQPLEAPKSVPDYFPTLEAIAEVDENEEGPHNEIEILQLDDGDDIEGVDPDNAEYVKESAPGYFADPSDGNVPTGGIGHTLLKVDYICHGFHHLRRGYGIQWNVAYDCWQRAYAARRVIDQLLEDKTDKFAGKSAAGHFYKGYEISKKEWENVNSVTIVLEEFLALTLSMEEDGPNALMVLYKYCQLIDSLEKKKIAPEFAALQVMFDPMIKVAKKYLDIALGCTPILLATVVHPAWRMSLIKDKFPEYEDIALSLVQAAFKAKQEAHNQMLPEPAVPDSNAEDSDKEEFNYYPVKNGSSQDTNELKKYLDGAYPLGKKGDPLNWWMVSEKADASEELGGALFWLTHCFLIRVQTHQSEFPRLASVARDALAYSATSATVERTFSAAANVCSPGRNSLAATTIERCVSSHMWLQKGIKADGEFSDCQSVIDTASANPKFATQVANENKKIKAKKIKHVANPKTKSKQLNKYDFWEIKITFTPTSTVPPSGGSLKLTSSTTDTSKINETCTTKVVERTEDILNCLMTHQIQTSSALNKLVEESANLCIELDQAYIQLNRQQIRIDLLLNQSISPSLSATRLILKFDLITPIILMTSNVQSVDLLRYMNTGMYLAIILPNRLLMISDHLWDWRRRGNSFILSGCV
ncbi:hypothetical protein H4Q26_018332, partial [Puccinia striiformis f. sp. tritici PST-130]